ncbi:MAG: DUF3301 domain-containing protein [Gammaproteobacteria bacterium]|nr:DUF3301 domain-containing protein [Gammaproteobacteria bacterium]
MSLLTLASLTLLAALIALWWQSDQVKRRALQLVRQRCSQLNLQLLDQTMVLRGLWPGRDSQGVLRMRRRYEFEFTSTGQTRHTGLLVLVGAIVQSLELEPHPIPEERQNLH